METKKIRVGVEDTKGTRGSLDDPSRPAKDTRRNPVDRKKTFIRNTLQMDNTLKFIWRDPMDRSTRNTIIVWKSC